MQADAAGIAQRRDRTEGSWQLARQGEQADPSRGTAWGPQFRALISIEAVAVL